MKKILFLIILTAFLTACGMQNETTQTGSTTNTETTTTDTASNNSETNNSENNTDTIENREITVYYILRDTNENGEIIEANMNADGTPMEGKQPLISEMKNLVIGFQKGVKDMKVGETKSFTVTPEEGYGTDTIVQSFNFEEVAPKITQVIPKNILTGRVNEKLKLAEIPEQMKSKYIDGKNPGDIIMEEEGATAKLISKTDEIAEIEITNPNTPFFNKEIKVGEKGTIKDPLLEKEIGFTTLKVENDMVTVEFLNTDSPFTGKEFVVGTTGEQEVNGKKISYKVIAIDDENATERKVQIEIPNPSPMANKTLHFTVKMISNEPISPASIIPATPEVTTPTQQ